MVFAFLVNRRAGSVSLTGLLFIYLLCWAQPQAVAATNQTLRVMAANLNGNSQTYEPFALRIFQGLKPDVVAIQEFNYGNNTPAEFRAMVDAAFGTNFVYFREPGSYNIPNGIISRYPILSAGSWDDTLLNDRGFAWAQIDLPGSNDLYVVSVHLYSSGSAANRNSEATMIKGLITTNFPAGAWIIVAGDFNTDTRSESAISTFKTFLSDSPIPTDAESGGNPNTNRGRDKPYDYVLPSFSLTNRLISLVLPSRTFPSGLVFDSTVYTPLTNVSPVMSSDSPNAQHMAVIKDFDIGNAGTNASSIAPTILTQPESRSVLQGANVLFSTAASGTAPLSYQWRFDGAVIDGATDATYSLTNVQSANQGGYSVVVANDFGSATSAVATLTIIVPVVTNTGAIIAQWNFNATNAATLNSPPPSIGAGSVSLVGGTTATWAGGSSTDTNSSNNAWNTTTYPGAGTANKTAGARFNVSTAGRRNISIRWDQRNSSTASKYARLQYTTNGLTFIDYPAPIAATTSFAAKTNILTGFPGVDNNANFAFQIVSEFESTAVGNANQNYVPTTDTSTYAGSGTMRFDMVTVSGELISPPSTPATALLVNPAVDADSGARFTVTGTTAAKYIVQASTNLASQTWTSIYTNAAPFDFSDTNTSRYPMRFYRAIALP